MITRLPAGIPVRLWLGGIMGLATLVLGGLGLGSGCPLLFPTLGPTLVLQAHSPDLPSARPFTVVVGQGLAIDAAMLTVWAAGAGDALSVLSTDLLTPIRLAAAFALAGSFAAQTAIGDVHPPAATILLIVLGGSKVAWAAAAMLIAGVGLLIALGEPIRHAARSPRP